MLWTIAVVLFIVWAMGVATAYTVSDILLVLAIVAVLLRLIQGRRPVL